MDTFNHSRSNSLPSRSHPTATIVEDHLSRLKSADTTCSSTYSIGRNLASLANLHESLCDLIQLPSTQKELSNSSIDEILDGSVRLLDVCSITKDILVQMKESVKDLESAVRRNRGGESNIAHHVNVNVYASSKKIVNKMITKCVKTLKISEKKCSVSNKCNVLLTMAMMQESEAISFSILKSVLLYLSGSNNKPKQKGWSLINKFLQSKHKQADHVPDTKQLRTLQMTIQELEELLETIYKSLIKRRVSLLNIISH